MQENIIAKKYAKALVKICSTENIHQAYTFFHEISKAFCLKKFHTIISSHTITRNNKLILLKSLTNQPVDTYTEKLLELLVQNDRIPLLPFVALELKKILDAQSNTYQAILYSKQPLAQDSLTNIQTNLGKKLGVTLHITQKTDNSIEGIRLDVEDLGIEVAFLKNQFVQELQDFILKAF